MGIFSRVLAALKYQAIENRPTRRPIYVSLRSEDRELPTEKRRRLISEARDQQRNFSLAGFALRKHLQFVSYYRFFASTPDREFNKRLESLVERWKEPRWCDAQRRRGFNEIMTIIEAHRAIDGDVGVLKRADGRLQLIESDRIATPSEYGNDPGWVNGVYLDHDGVAQYYSVCKRKDYGGYEFERVVSARDLDLPAYLTRADQIRGVSLFAPAVEMVSYLYDGLSYALAKLKLEQILGLKTKLDDGGSIVSTYEQSATDDAESVNRKAAETFGSDVMHLALKVGEDAEFMESSNPSQNFQNFCESIIRMIFAALDVPFSFYDGSQTNFYGSEGEFEQYLDSVEKKQAPMIATMNGWIFDWLLPNWIFDGLIELPRGWTLDDLRGDVGWRGSGAPSWRLFRNVKEVQAGISAGLVSPLRVADSYGEDMLRNIDELAQIRRYSASQDVFMPYGEEQKINNGL